MSKSLYNVFLENIQIDQFEMMIGRNEFAYLQATKQNLFSLLNKSICVCPLCTNDENDVVYIPRSRNLVLC